MHNTKGSTSAFATFSPYKSYGDLCCSFLSLTFAWTQTAGVRQLHFLHTAHFSVVPPWKLRRAGLTGKNIRFGALLFASAYNDDAENYFRKFSDELAPVLNTVWRWCVGWTRASPYAELDRYIRTYERPSLSFFNVYPDNCRRVRSSLVLRRQLDNLYARALSGSAADFKAAFERVSLSHWGDVEPKREEL